MDAARVFVTFAAVFFSPPTFPELRWTHARVGFEVLAEGELLGEADFVGHLLDLDIGLAEEVLGLVDGDHVDPLHRGITRFPFDDVRKVARCKTLSLCIIIDFPMLPILHVECQQKSHHDLPLVRERLLLLQ